MNIRWYKDCDGEEVDLDNLNTYSIYPKWQNKTSLDLWDLGWIASGKSLFYMDYLNYGVDWGEQRKRVNRFKNKLIKYLKKL